MIGHVYVNDNTAGIDTIGAFDRHADGTLIPQAGSPFAAGGAGTGAGLRLAVSFVPSRVVAEEVVQDTWLAVLRGLDGFEGRSSLRTWVFRILVDQARTTGTREQRSVPVADPEPVVDPSRFDATGGWADPPEHWIEAAEGRMAAGKLADRIRA